MQAGKITWESRREKAKETFFISAAMSLLSGYLRSSQRMYLVRISAPAPRGRNRGPISPGRVRSATPYFSDCPNQCAALYLVRILSAARCAGFRQAKSPGRVGRCRISEHPPSTIIRHYCFFFGDRIAYRAHFISCACTGA